MLVIEKDSFVGGPSDDRVLKLEGFSRIKYPKSYIDFLKSYNGGIPETKRFKRNNNNEHVIERFLCMTDSPDDSVLGDYDLAVVMTQLGARLSYYPDELGDELIPIASLFAGNFVCFDYRKSKTDPCVCIWDHEESDDFAPVTYYVANSFEAFIDMLEFLE